MDAPLERLTQALADRYTVEHEIGRGGMATVYLAQDLKHDRQVAVKVLRPELAAGLGAGFAGPGHGSRAAVRNGQSVCRGTDDGDRGASSAGAGEASSVRRGCCGGCSSGADGLGNQPDDRRPADGTAGRFAPGQPHK